MDDSPQSDEHLPLDELRTAEPPSRPELIESLAERLHRLVPGFRTLAKDLLADSSRIDVVGVAGDGSPVLAVLGEEAEALTLLARALAHRAWLEPRLADWLKLAPELPLRPELPIQAIVLCPRFGAEALAAAATLPGVLCLATWRYLRNGTLADLLIEPVAVERRPAAPPGPQPRPRPAQSTFRTGLSEEDLGLSEAEQAEFGSAASPRDPIPEG